MLIGVILAVCPAACDEQSAAIPDKPGEQRLVSLSPAVTQMIIDLGVGQRIVGVGSFDPAAPPGAAVVGDLYTIDYEKLLSLKPTDIFIQPPREGMPARLEELASSFDWRIHRCRIETIDDIRRTLIEPSADDSPGGVGPAVGRPQRAAELAEQITGQLNAIADLTATTEPPRTLILIGLSPLSAAGHDTFLGQMLRIAGGANALDPTTTAYPQFDRERLLSLAPEAIIILTDISGATPSPQQALPPILRNLNIPAVSQNRVDQLNDPLAMLPSTSVPRVTAQIARLLHPELLEQLSEIVPIDAEAGETP
jgi:ABC-type Fe3+-hydroxamate transport system substrate-binding protein